MYSISNRDRDALIKLLPVIQKLQGDDTKTANIKRNALILIRKLNKATPHNDTIKHNTQ